MDSETKLTIAEVKILEGVELYKEINLDDSDMYELLEAVERSRILLENLQDLIEKKLGRY